MLSFIRTIYLDLLFRMHCKHSFNKIFIQALFAAGLLTTVARTALVTSVDNERFRDTLEISCAIDWQCYRYVNVDVSLTLSPLVKLTSFVDAE